MDWMNFLMRNYPKFYSKEDVKVFVSTGKITEVQYQEITGDPYTV